jgi:hypothetical protein
VITHVAKVTKQLKCCRKPDDKRLDDFGMFEQEADEVWNKLHPDFTTT